jgi:hypothetical protein
MVHRLWPCGADLSGLVPWKRIQALQDKKKQCLSVGVCVQGASHSRIQIQGIEKAGCELTPLFLIVVVRMMYTFIFFGDYICMVEELSRNAYSLPMGLVLRLKIAKRVFALS